MDDDENINRIEKPEIIAKVLTRHFKTRGILCLSTLDGEFKAETRIIDNDPFAEYLLLDQVPALVAEPLEHAEIIEVHGSIDSLYSWFQSRELHAIIEAGERYYELPYPERLFQLQRRNSFRINLPHRLTATITAEIQDAKGEPRSFQAVLEDLSATGAAMLVNSTRSLPIQEGVTLHEARIRVPDLLDMTLDAKVRNCRRGLAKNELVMGLEFLCLSTQDAQAITRSVMEIQRRILAEADP
jgi:c-di-GMP-binding flagellar brake protein YcgR